MYSWHHFKVPSMYSWHDLKVPSMRALVHLWTVLSTRDVVHLQTEPSMCALMHLLAEPSICVVHLRSLLSICKLVHLQTGTIYSNGCLTWRDRMSEVVESSLAEPSSSSEAEGAARSYGTVALIGDTTHAGRNGCLQTLVSWNQFVHRTRNTTTPLSSTRTAK